MLGCDASRSCDREQHEMILEMERVIGSMKARPADPRHLALVTLHAVALKLAEAAGVCPAGCVGSLALEAERGDTRCLSAMACLDVEVPAGLDPVIAARVARVWDGMRLRVDDAGILGRIYDLLHWNQDESRRKKGAFYTRPDLARYLVRATLGSVLSGNTKRVIGFLDPACGGGAFLIEAVRFLRDEPAACPCVLYGVDVDPVAAEVTRFSLSLLAKGLKGVAVRVKAGDSLISSPGAERATRRGFDYESEFPEVFQGDARGFTVIAGNPPWFRIKEMDDREEKAWLSRYFKTRYRFQKGNYNLYKLFWERALEMVCEGGYIAFVHPASFLGEDQSVRLRRELFDGARVQEVINLPFTQMNRLFGKAPVMEGAATVVKMERTADYPLRIVWGLSSEEDHALLQKNRLNAITGARYEVPMLTKPGLEVDLLEKVSIHAPLGSLVSAVGEGPFHETADRDLASRERTGDLLVRGVHVRRYRVNLDEGARQPRWVNREGFIARKPASRRVLEATPKLVGRQMVHRAEARRLHFSVLEGDLVLSNGVRYLILKDGVDPWYVLGLLNSCLLDWRFSVFSRTFNIKPYELRALPIARGAFERDVSVLARGLSRGYGEPERMEADLDDLVYAAYDLSGAERALVEKKGPRGGGPFS